MMYSVSKVFAVLLTSLSSANAMVACPWLDGSSGETSVLQCIDGTTCLVTADLGPSEGWSCCHNHGGRARCPLNYPHMCAKANSCAGGTEYCCVHEVALCEETEEGLRGCDAAVEVDPMEIDISMQVGDDTSEQVVRLTNNGTSPFVVDLAFHQVREASRRLTEEIPSEPKDVKIAETRKVIFRLKDNGADKMNTLTILQSVGILSVRSMTAMPIEIGELSPDSDLDSVLKALDKNPNVLYAEPDFAVTIDDFSAPNDPKFSDLWGMHNNDDHDIDALEAWAIHRGLDRSVIVGVIDTGVDYNHPDLRDQMWTNPNEIPNNGIDDDNNGYVDDVHGANFITGSGDPMDDNAHGTHCAGTIGASGNNGVGVVGVTWGPRIMALKFLSAGGSGSISDALEALNYAIMMGAHLTSNSWGGGGRSQAFHDAIEAANQANQLFIAAAGNSNSDNDVRPHYPSNYQVPNVISVAATTITDDRASFSCFGRTTVHIGAPGHNIMSTVPNGGYRSFSGTSMATPHVAGLAALVLDFIPSMTNMELKEALLSTGDPIAALEGKTITGARINARRALEFAQGRFGVFGIVGNSSRMLLPGTSEEVVIHVGSHETREGRYQAQLTLKSGEWTGNATMVTLTAIGTPDFVLFPELLDFEEVATGTRVTKTMYIKNNGTGSARLLSVHVEDTDNWALNEEMPSMPQIIGPGEEVTVLLHASPRAVGNLSTRMVVTTDVAGQETLEAPIVGRAVDPANVEAFPSAIDLEAGAQDLIAEAPIHLSNVGGLALSYEARLEGVPPFEIRHSGTEELPFDWVEINETGHRVTALNNVDDGAASVQLPWNFRFWGIERDAIFISSNGFITFDSAGAGNYNPALPSEAAPNGVIAPYWTDLKLESGSAVFVEEVGIDGHSAFVIEWYDVAYYNPRNSRATFQVILFQDGRLKTFVKDAKLDYSRNLAIGIEHDDGNDGSNLKDAMYNSGSLVTNATVHVNPMIGMRGNLSGQLQPAEISGDLTLVAYPTAIGAGSSLSATVVIRSHDRNGIQLEHRSVPVVVRIRNETTSTSTTSTTTTPLSTTTSHSSSTTSTTTTPQSTTTSSNRCPWIGEDSGEALMLDCMDGTSCLAFLEVGEHGGWDCCSSHGGRARCPRVFPFMCARPNSCAGGTAHCCAERPEHCDATEGGLRGCEDEVDSRFGGRRLRGSSMGQFLV